MSDYGFHYFAHDWIGFGFSDKPQPGYGFDYIGFYISLIRSLLIVFRPLKTTIRLT